MDSEVVKKVWTKLGAEEPYWSVLTEEGYKKEKWEAHEAQFYRTGENQIEWVKWILGEYSIKPELFTKVLDYGCGVGRLTKAWDGAEGCDISEPHLEKARALLPDRTFHLIEPGECPKGYDFIFSLIVLQHNRPELMKKCFESILDALNPRGYAFLHAPYWIEHINRSDEEMEMNYLPKEDVRAVAEAKGCLVVREDESHDLCGGNIKNCCYLIYKKA